MINKGHAERVKRHLEAIPEVVSVSIHAILHVVTHIPESQDTDAVWDKVIAAERDILDALDAEGIDLPLDFNVETVKITPIDLLALKASKGVDTPAV